MKSLFNHLKKLNKIQIEVKNEEQDREEKLCDEAYNTGFANGRKFEREVIKQYLVEQE
jgi:hypothetical protein